MHISQNFFERKQHGSDRSIERRRQGRRAAHRHKRFHIGGAETETPSDYRGDPTTDQHDPTGEELAYLAQGEDWYAEEGGYEHLQRTRPLTAAYALNDSPVGLLAWLLEKYHMWTDHEDGAIGLDDDLILTQASLYWFTGTIASSFRPYWEHRTFPPGPVMVTVPTGLAVFPADLVQPPRSWAGRNYNVVHYTRMPRGGHFAALEQPDLLAADIRAFAAVVLDRP